METAKEKTTIETIRTEIANNCPMLREDQVLQMFKDYGLEYLPSDATTLRICMLLASAERKLLNSTTF